MRRLRAAAVACSVVALLAGCTAGSADVSVPTGDPPVPTASPTASASARPSGPIMASPGPSPTPERPAPTTPAPVRFDVDRAQRTVDDLAGRIGPREATSPAFVAAGRYVQARLQELGYEVRRAPFDVPAGVSWGVPVPAGRTANVLATAPGTDLRRPFLVVGAHLDTVPQAPGAADNASGIAVLLETARLAAQRPPRVPLVLVAFAAEEPRGPGDDLHHFGSQQFVASLTAAQRRALVGAIAVDTVGVSRSVPICSATTGGDPFTQRVRRDVRAAGISVRDCENRTSDHWSFVRDGLPGLRVGLAGTQEYAQYHSAGDGPSVIDPRALKQAGRAVWAAVRAADWAR